MRTENRPHRLPKKQIGMLFPVDVVDITPYEFYRMVAEDVMLLVAPLGLRRFTREDLDLALQHAERFTAMFKSRGVDLVLQDGVPVALLLGPAEHRRMLDDIHRQTGIATTSTIECVIAALAHLGVRRLAVANKWSTDMNVVLGTFFERHGIDMATPRSRSMAPDDFVRLTNAQSLALAEELARAALRSDTSAEALYIAGGSWLTAPIIESIERETGVPVVTNTTAIVWHCCRLMGCTRPIEGYGRLLSEPTAESR